MSDTRKAVLELLKYPILVFSILVAIIILKVSLGLEFGPVTEVGSQGVKFAEQGKATLEALAELEAKVNEAAVRLEALENPGDEREDSRAQVQSKAFSASQTVSDATAQVARLQNESGGSDREVPRGYIWIGNYQGNSWERAMIGRPDTGQPVEIAPADMRQGTEYITLGNMVLRDGLPANDEQYFRGRENLGVVPRGTRFSIKTPPTGIDREFAVQFWAEVEVLRGKNGG